MEEKGETLDRTADIMTLLGELRRMVFAWEVRATHQDPEGLDPDGEGGDPADPSSDPESDPEGRAAGAAPDEALEGDAEGDSEESAAERIVRESLEQERRFLEGLDPEE